MKASEIRELTDAELQHQLDESQRELLHLRIQAKTGQLENTARLRLLRRDIARVRTELRARQERQEQQA